MTPFVYRRDGEIGQLLNLPVELARSSSMEGKSWNDVQPTESTFRSVSSLLKELSSSFREQISGLGLHRWDFSVFMSLSFRKMRSCGSQSLILITFYFPRRNIALTQLMVGTVRIAVALMVMAAEIDVSMSVRIFEELTQPQLKPNGLLSMQCVVRLIS